MSESPRAVQAEYKCLSRYALSAKVLVWSMMSSMSEQRERAGCEDHCRKLAKGASWQGRAPALLLCFSAAAVAALAVLLSGGGASSSGGVAVPKVAPAPSSGGSMSALAGFTRLRSIQFIAALGDPAASSGTGAQHWGIWRVDPGPRGVPIGNFGKLATAKRAPAGWTLDAGDFWVEEHGLIMEAPDVPIVQAGGRAQRFLVSGDREVTTVLTVQPDGRWALEKGTLHDVTHLPCRSARYKGSFTPGPAAGKQFPVTPGGPMPALAGCAHQDYYVLFVLAVATTN